MHIVLHAHACVLYYVYVHDDVMLVYAHCAKFAGNMTSLNFAKQICMRKHI